MENLCVSVPESKPRSLAGQIPADFDPAASPILAQHWYGLSPTKFCLQREVELWLLERRVRRSLLGQSPGQSSSRRSSSPRLLASAGT